MNLRFSQSPHRTTCPEQRDPENRSFYMIGTVVNTAAIVAGGMVGLFLKKSITERYKTILMQAIGL